MQLTGTARALPEVTVLPSDAYAFGATRLVHGYYDGATSFHISVEDTATHKMVIEERFNAPVLEAISKAALELDPQAHPFSTSKQASVEAWAAGNSEQAVALDPGFSTGWLSWAEQLAQSNKQQALEVVSRALALKPPLKSEVDRAQLELVAATIKDDVQGRGAALDKIVHLIPQDSRLWNNLAESSMLARNFPKAVEAYRETLRLSPSDGLIRNMLGYSQAYAGDLDSARASLVEYGKVPGQAANSLDSMGEVSFLNGKFKEAEDAFLSVSKTSPGFLGGAALAKAAYARWFGGNQEGADQLMRDFLIARVKEKDPNTDWREAVWLYSTGRAAQAQASLEKALVSGNLTPEARTLVEKQIQVWKNPALPRDPDQLKAIYDHTPPAQDSLVRVLYAAALLERGQKDEARRLLKHWPLPETGGDPLLQGFLYPRFLETRRALAM